ncbi:hypothetical protein QJS10_CPA16g01742 [Acorus calamus]|uniref:Uncharacterized protein n=1 Tax=Acorus calamus TaxID=4465 RepID=A0AAV9D1Y1_ACOCL|nr:hypothetical protein QJS10_CPA16g01742 [Acorus calamus]
MMLQTEMNIRRVLNSENSTFGTNEDAKNYLSLLKSDLLENSSSVTESGVRLVDDVHHVTTKSVELNEQNRKFSSEAAGPPLFKAHELNKCDDQPTVMQLIRDELAETSGRLDTLKNRLDNLLSLHGKFSEGNQYLHPKRDSEIFLQDHEIEDSRQTLNNTNPNEALVQCLRKELESSVNRLTKMHLKLGMLVDGKEIALNTWAPGSSFHESVVAEINEASSSNQLFMSIDQVHQKFEPRIEEADADRCNSTEILSCQLSNARFITEEKMKHADRLPLKFEEAQETMKEADAVLTTLLDVNMRAKHNRDVWKRASEVLEAEKASLLEVVQSLQITILQQEKESEILQDDIHASTVEVLDSMVSLERSFLQIQMNVEEEMKAMHSEITSLGKDFLNCVGTLKIWLEDIASNMMEKGFVLFVLHLCHMGLNRMISSSDSNFCKYAPDVSHTLPSGMHKFCMNRGNIQKSNRVNEADEKIQMGHHVDQLSKIKLCSGENMAHSIQTIGNSSAVSVEYLERSDLCSDGNLFMQQTNIMMNSSSLKRELARKDVLLKGLLFDFRLLQELTSNAKDKKDETLGMMDALSQVRQELDHKTSQVDDILVQQRQLQIQLIDKEAEFNMVKSDLGRANSTIDMLADENNELRHLLEDLYVTKRDLNENLEEKQKVIEGLEKEILCLSSSVEEKLFSTVEGIEDEMRKVSHEKDDLRDELVSLNAKLDMAKTLADENEAIAVEARQVAEASKLYAEQKEEEVKILESSIEELEYTIDVLEKKVHEMGNEVKRHQFMRRDLEVELQTLQQRMAMIESAEDAVVEHSQDGERGQMHERCINLDQAKQCIKDLKIEKAKLVEEIKQYKDHIFELVLHSEAQASQFQQKVCALTARLATVESMTHDVIRDLLGVKMDMTNYANLIDHQQLQRALAQQATEESNAKENENLKLKKKIEELIEERERLKKEISKNTASILATQVKVEHLQQRDRLLTAQNEMLKMDKANLNQKIADMDVTAQKPSTSRSNQSQVGTTMRQSENHLSHEKEEIAWNFRTSDKAPFVRFSQGKRLHETLHEAEDEDALSELSMTPDKDVWSHEGGWTSPYNWH